MTANRSVTKLLRPLANWVLPDRETAVTVRFGVGEGLRLCILPRTEKYYWTGLHEVHVQQALQCKLQAGSVFWDVGAHIGFDSVIASRLVGPSGRVEAFEPSPANRRRLLATIQLNSCTNVTVHGQALSSRPGQGSFYVHASSLMGSLVDAPSSGTIDVACTTLDELAGQLPPPTLIKVDTEGAELDVLRGGTQLLATARPGLIVECTTNAVLQEACRLLPFYAATHLGKNHWLLQAE